MNTNRFTILYLKIQMMRMHVFKGKKVKNLQIKHSQADYITPHGSEKHAYVTLECLTSDGKMILVFHL